jgi:elongation factor P--(R)-beta-lysine ligase
MVISTHLANLENHRKYIKMLSLIESFFEEKGYDRISLPLLSPVLIPESYLEVFKTDFIYPTRRDPLYLTPSPELFLKRLLVQGLGNCYSLDKSFRNSEPSTAKHSHEFMMLEFYKVNGDYLEVAEIVLELMRYVSQAFFGQNTFVYNDKSVDLAHWEKITVAEAFLKYAGINSIFDHELFFKDAQKKGYSIEGHNYTDMWSQIYSFEVEPFLGTTGKPTLIYEYPRELAATAQFDEKKNCAERLELYIEGIELGNCGNAGTVNTNIEEHTRRFKKDIETRRENGMEEHPPDTEFLTILSTLPKCAGIALGVERLAMLFCNLRSINGLHVIQVEK